jgi:anti-sigma B factor antagonist
MSLGLSQSRTDAVVVLALKGTIVAGKDTELLTGSVQGFLEAGDTRILLDFSQITFIDSTGISAIIKTHLSAMRKGGSVKLVHLTKRIYDVLQITRLSSAFEIFDDTQKALASFGGAPEGGRSLGTAA